MNANTWDATPFLDEIISIKPFEGRVFDDGLGDDILWYEIERDQFLPDTSLIEARVAHKECSLSPSSELSLQVLYPEGRFV